MSLTVSSSTPTHKANPLVFKYQEDHRSAHTDCSLACTYHAIFALHALQHMFESYAALFSQPTQLLDYSQRQYIEIGDAQCNKDAVLSPIKGPLENRDLDQIRHNLRAYNFVIGKMKGKKEYTYEERLQRVTDSLFVNDKHLKGALIRSSSGRTFSVIKKGEQAIIFDSHENEMMLAEGRDAIKQGIRIRLEAEVGKLLFNDFIYSECKWVSICFDKCCSIKITV